MAEPDTARSDRSRLKRLVVLTAVAVGLSGLALGIAQAAAWPANVSFADRAALVGLVVGIAAYLVAAVGFFLALDQIDEAGKQAARAQTAAVAAREAVERAEDHLRRNNALAAASELLRLESAFDDAVNADEPKVASVRAALLAWRRGANQLRTFLEGYPRAAELGEQLRDGVTQATEAKLALDAAGDAEIPTALESTRKLIAQIGNNLEAFQERAKFDSGGDESVTIEEAQ